MLLHTKGIQIHGFMKTVYQKSEGLLTKVIWRRCP